MNKEYSIIITTVDRLDVAEKIIEELLSSKLAACIQTFNIHSSYIWKNAICKDDEIIIQIKTKTDLFNDVKSKIISLHPYETPEIIQVPVINGNQEYLNWIDGLVKNV